MKQAVVGILFSEDRKSVLVIQRRDVNIWALPGGGVEQLESPEDAVIREVQEETGLKITIARKIAEYEPLNKLACKTHLFECSLVEGSLATGPETRNLGFFSISKLPPSLFHLHFDWIQDALLNQQEIIRKSITQITYKQAFCYFLRHPIQVIRFALSQLGLPINTP